MVDVIENTPNNTSTVTAEVNAPKQVTLFSPEGITIQALEKDVQKLLRKGFSLYSFDPLEFINELKVQVNNLPSYIATLEADIACAKEIDTSADSSLKIFEVALNGLLQSFDKLETAIHATLPVKQAETVEVDHPTLGKVEADPSLVTKLISEGASLFMKIEEIV